MPSPPAPWVSPEEVEVRLNALAISGADLPVSVARICQAATDFLYERSGRRFNSETWTVRPVRVSGSCGCIGRAEDQEHLARDGPCSCFDSAREVVLTPHPVTRIEEVKVDGVVLASSAYALYDLRRLVRVDDGSWPCCQRLSSPLTEDGTWSVKFRGGDTVPELGYIAALELAYQMALFVAPSNVECQLPSRAVSVTRQGIQIQMADVTYLQEGMFGIPVIDEFLLAFGSRPRASFMGPDDVRLRST